MTSVAVLGGGVGGLSAAHELAERGFDVTVYEMREAFGGKARSMPVPGSAHGGREPLPGEHGFRFFPGFYRHLTDTMERIPHPVGNTVAHHLVDATRILLARAHKKNELIVPAQAPDSLSDYGAVAQFLYEFGFKLGIRPWELAFFFVRLTRLLVSCDERRLHRWEHRSWWEYTHADKLSESFQKFLADGLTRTLVAARAKEMSARTGGLILLQILFDVARVGGRADRVLDGPTSEVWIDPWTARLKRYGVTLRTGCEVTGIECQGRRIVSAMVHTIDGPETVIADHYIAALPVERLIPLITHEMRAADPQLARLDKLVWRWMNGVIFYLDRDIPLERGHAIFIDSDWSLTAISQAQFWPDVNLEKRGDGRVDGILSIDVSDWDRPSRRTGMRARDCTQDEIFDEVWAQVVDHIDHTALNKSNIVARFLDPAVVLPNPAGPTKEAVNLEPLLINTAGSWENRPEAVTSIENLFLAADFVRTHTDLATMESANEAARRAVNGILDASGSLDERCEVWKLREPRIVAPLRALDRLLWRLSAMFRRRADGERLLRRVA
jgi:uncharacterized protein with NAD-binding domain and iron-sulfur cluster